MGTGHSQEYSCREAGKDGLFNYGHELWGNGYTPHPKLAEYISTMASKLVERNYALEKRVKKLEGLVDTLRKHAVSNGEKRIKQKKQKKNPPVPLIDLGPEIVTMRQVLSAVARKHEMTQGTILSRSRSREIVEARNEAFYHSQKLGKSLPQIGRFYARDHTTVLNGIRRHKQRMEAAE